MVLRILTKRLALITDLTFILEDIGFYNNYKPDT